MLFESSGHSKEAFLSIEEVFIEMIKKKCINPTFSISYFDLFIYGLTNICRQLFFSMSLAINIAEFNIKGESGISIGSLEQVFLHNYVKFVVSQNLARIEYDDYLIDYKERELQPIFLATITYRGEQFPDLVMEKEKSIISEFPDTMLVSERFLTLEYLPFDYKRFEKGKKLQDLIACTHLGE